MQQAVAVHQRPHAEHHIGQVVEVVGSVTGESVAVAVHTPGYGVVDVPHPPELLADAVGVVVQVGVDVLFEDLPVGRVVVGPGLVHAVVGTLGQIHATLGAPVQAVELVLKDRV